MSRGNWRDPNDARDPEVAERLEARDPDGFMGRREFLQKAALTGGLAMGMAGLLSPDTILAEAAAATRTDVPAAANLPLDTIVVLMMENRSFDHYLGWLPGADGRQAGLTFTDLKSASYATHRLQGIYQGKYVYNTLYTDQPTAANADADGFNIGVSQWSMQLGFRYQF